MKLNTKNIVRILLILAIILGVFFRAHQLNYPHLGIDDQIFAVSALKIHHQSFQDGVKYVWNHPPLGKYLAGIFTISSYDPSFEILNSIPPQMFGYSHLAYIPLQKTLPLIHFSYLFFGLLSLILVYLITKELYSADVALWATALFSISLDFISLSRSLYPEHFMIFLMLLFIYFYIYYVYSPKKQPIILVPLFVSLLFLVNSRQFQPVILAIIFLSHYILFNFFKFKDLQNSFKGSLDLIVVYILAAISTFFLYRPLPPSEFTHSFVIQFGFQIHKILITALFRNSYLSLLGFILLGVLVIQDMDRLKIMLKKPSLFFEKKRIIPYVLLLSILSMVFFDFPYESIFRYLCFISAWLIILEGVALEKFMNSNKKIIKIIILLTLILTVYQMYDASQSHPPFVLESNFNVEGFAMFPDNYLGGLNSSIFPEIEKLGNPPIITSIPWFADFYKGKIIIPPLRGTNACTQEYFNQLKDEGAYLFVEYPDFFETQPWASCPEFRSLNFTEEKSFFLKNKYGYGVDGEMVLYSIG